MKILEKMRGEGVEEKSLELLRSQDRVVSMLYHKTFPVPSKGGVVPTRQQIEVLKVTPEDIRSLRPHTASDLPNSASDDHANGQRPTTVGLLGHRMGHSLDSA